MQASRACLTTRAPLIGDEINMPTEPQYVAAVDNMLFTKFARRGRKPQRVGALPRQNGADAWRRTIYRHTTTIYGATMSLASLDGAFGFITRELPIHRHFGIHRRQRREILRNTPSNDIAMSAVHRIVRFPEHATRSRFRYAKKAALPVTRARSWFVDGYQFDAVDSTPDDVET